MRRKRLKIDQAKLDLAKHILQVATEQDAIDRALDAVIGEEAIARALRRARGVGGMIDAFGGRRLNAV